MVAKAQEIWGKGGPVYDIYNQRLSFTKVFPKVAKLLGTILTDEADLRHVVCTGLQALIGHAQPPADRTTTGEESNADKATLANYAKNFLPCLFNLYNGPITPELRNTVLSTIKKYLTLTNLEVQYCFLDDNTQLYFASFSLAMLTLAGQHVLQECHTKAARWSRRLCCWQLWDASAPSYRSSCSVCAVPRNR